MIRHSVIPTGALLLLLGSAYGQVTKVTVHPSFETAGIDLLFQGSPSSSVTIEYRKAGSSGAFIKAHPPVRYDGRHAATSLFELTPGTAYEVKINGKTESFTTRRPFSLPPPKEVVKINPGDSAGLRAALKAAAPGTEIQIPQGKYTGGFTVTKSGTAANPIVVTGVISDADKGKPIEQRTSLPVLTNSAGAGFVVQNAAHVVLQHVKVADSQSYGIDLDACRHCVIQYCQVYDNDNSGATDWRLNIYVRHGGSNDPATTAGYSLIQFNHIADTTPKPFNAGPVWDGAEGITYYGINNNDQPGPGLVIRGNRIEGHYDCIVPCPDEGDSMDPGENNSDVLGQLKQSSHNVEVYDNIMPSCRDDGIESDGLCVNARIYRNTIEKAHNGVSIAPALPGPFFWLRNRVHEVVEGAIKINTGVASGQATIRNHYFYHNTFTRKSSSGYLMNLGGGSTASKLIHYKNNIFRSNSELIDIWDNHVPKPISDGNIWYSTSSTQMRWHSGKYSSFSAFKSGTGQEAHGKWADPLLDGALNLKSGSPAIDSAMPIPGINHIVGGAGPDVGADEKGRPPPPPVPDAGPPTSPAGDAGGHIPPDVDAGITTGDNNSSNNNNKPGPGNVLEGGCSVTPACEITLFGLPLLFVLLLLALRSRRRG